MYDFLYNRKIYPNQSSVISIYDRGFSLGDGVFETIKITDSQPELWSLHLDRLINGCSVLNIDLQQDIFESLYADALHLMVHNQREKGVLKIIISRQSFLRGLTFDANSNINILMMLADLPKQPLKISAVVSDIRRNETSPLSRIKSLNYGDNILAYNDAHSKGYDDALMLNSKGQPCCFTTGNIVIENLDGLLLTPPPQTGCLGGTFVKNLANIKYQDFTLDDAIKIWRSNCITGIVPVDLQTHLTQ